MDGLSAASAVIQVLGASLVLSQKIASFIVDAKDVAQTRSQLLDQVESLYTTVKAVHTVLKRRESQLSTRFVGDDEREIYEQTERTLKKTQRSVQWLEEVLEKLGGGRTRMCWEKAWLQMKFQVRNPAIAKISRQIETSVSSLQLMLQCINVFVHEETQTVVQTGFDMTNASIAEIHTLVAELRRLVQQPVVGDEIELAQLLEEDTAAATEAKLELDLDDIEDEASDMASECISVANSLCGKISQSTTIIQSAKETSWGADENVNVDGLEAIPNEESIAGGRDEVPGAGPTFLESPLRKATTSLPIVSTGSPKGKPFKGPAVERLEVLTDHIDNDYHMAITALNNGEYRTAQFHIIGALETGKEREDIHSFPFEDELAYREILAFAKAKNGEFENAKLEYETLLEDAESTPCSKGTTGRICYALAQLYHSEYCEKYMGQKDDKLFEDWKNYALHAYESALKVPGRPDSAAVWKTHPSLTQTGTLLSQLYTYWGKPAKARTYQQRHPSQSPLKVSIPVPVPDRRISMAPLPDLVPPTPPDSDGQLERVVSQSSFPGTNLEKLHASNSAASGRLVLHAIEKNDYETTKYFLDLSEESVDMELRNERGLTPLLLAVQKRRTEIVRLLLEHEKGPDIKSKDKSGWSVLHYALSGQDGEDMVELLVQHEADVNAAANDGSTPLHYAVLNNKLHGAEILLRHPVLLEAQDKAKRTPMYLAVQKKKHEMVGLLISAKAVCDRTAWDTREMKHFFEECEDMGYILPVPPAETPARRRESILSTMSKKPSFFRSSRNSIG